MEYIDFDKNSGRGRLVYKNHCSWKGFLRILLIKFYQFLTIEKVY